MNVKQLKAALKAANVQFNSKASKAELEALYVAATATKQRKQRASTKTLLRNLFVNVGDTYSVADVIAHVTAQHAVQVATINTMLGDLRNVKYAAGPTINIVREGDNYIRKD